MQILSSNSTNLVLAFNQCQWVLLSFCIVLYFSLFLWLGGKEKRGKCNKVLKMTDCNWPLLKTWVFFISVIIIKGKITSQGFIIQFLVWLRTKKMIPSTFNSFKSFLCWNQECTDDYYHTLEIMSNCLKYKHLTICLKLSKLWD